MKRAIRPDDETREDGTASRLAYKFSLAGTKCFRFPTEMDIMREWDEFKAELRAHDLARPAILEVALPWSWDLSLSHRLTYDASFDGALGHVGQLILRKAGQSTEMPNGFPRVSPPDARAPPLPLRSRSRPQ